MLTDLKYMLRILVTTVKNRVGQVLDVCWFLFQIKQRSVFSQRRRPQSSRIHRPLELLLLTVVLEFLVLIRQTQNSNNKTKVTLALFLFFIL